MSEHEYDVAVIGGGPAGLAAAVMLARAHRGTVVIDAGEPRNRVTSAMHGFLSRDGVSPAEFLAAGRTEAERFGARIVGDEAISASATDDSFRVELAGGARITARRLLVTAGAVDELPDVAGIQELWGQAVVGCPLCHGFEMHDRTVVVIGLFAEAYQHAITWRQWCPNITLLTHAAPEPDATQAAMLAAAGLKTVVGRAARMVIEGGRLVGIELTDASTVPCDAVALKPRVTVRSTLLDSLGVAREQDEYGSRVTVESDGATSVPGVWAAGNVTNGALQVMAASVAGANAASAINADLTNADLRRKLQRMAGVAPAPPRAH